MLTAWIEDPSGRKLLLNQDRLGGGKPPWIQTSKRRKLTNKLKCTIKIKVLLGWAKKFRLVWLKPWVFGPNLHILHMGSKILKPTMNELT